MMAPTGWLSQSAFEPWGCGTVRSRQGRPGRIRMSSDCGALRRDFLDHVLISGEQHLRRVLTAYSACYIDTRTHPGLGKDAPLRRPIKRSGIIVATPISSGLYHRYARI
jgi:hypothetical protein